MLRLQTMRVDVDDHANSFHACAHVRFRNVPTIFLDRVGGYSGGVVRPSS